MELHSLTLNHKRVPNKSCGNFDSYLIMPKQPKVPVSTSVFLVYVSQESQIKHHFGEQC